MSTSTSIDLNREIDALRQFYADTHSRLDDDVLFDAVPSVSAWSPAQHLFHIWRANASMLKAARLLAVGAVDSEAPDLSDVGAQVLRSGTMPRGVADAPDNVRPPDELDRDALEDAWSRSRAKLDSLADDVDAVNASTGGLSHPAWGTLTATQWVRAARVHSDHHAAILDDVESAR